MKIKDLPTEIQEIVFKRQIEQGNEPNSEISLTQQTSFDWNQTIEGDSFWHEIYKGNLHVFYEKYPEKKPNGYVDLGEEIIRIRAKVFNHEQDYEGPFNKLIDKANEVSENIAAVKQYDFINPNHYKKFSIETIDMMCKIWGREATAVHCEMCAFKYRIRMGEKPDQPINRDMEKVNWYLNKAKELRS